MCNEITEEIREISRRTNGNNILCFNKDELSDKFIKMYEESMYDYIIL